MARYQVDDAQLSRAVWDFYLPRLVDHRHEWATFLMSLKQLVETGAGEPYPQEVRISNWT